MRTTLTLDDDVAAELKARMRAEGLGLKEAVNDTLRAGLRLGQKPAKGPGRFVVEPFASPFQAGVDASRLTQLVDELETDDFLAKVQKGSRRK